MEKEEIEKIINLVNNKKFRFLYDGRSYAQLMLTVILFFFGLFFSFTYHSGAWVNFFGGLTISSGVLFGLLDLQRPYKFSDIPIEQKIKSIKKFSSKTDEKIIRGILEKTEAYYEDNPDTWSHVIDLSLDNNRKFYIKCDAAMIIFGTMMTAVSGLMPHST